MYCYFFETYDLQLKNIPNITARHRFQETHPKEPQSSNNLLLFFNRRFFDVVYFNVLLKQLQK